MKYLSDFFSEAVESPFPFEGGVLEGPQDRHVGCVWFDTVRPNRVDRNNEEAFFGVRIFVQHRADQGATADVPREKQEERLEWTVERLEDALQAVRTRALLQVAVGTDFDLSDWHDYFLVDDITVNHPGQYVQATVIPQARARVRRGG